MKHRRLFIIVGMFMVFDWCIAHLGYQRSAIKAQEQRTDEKMQPIKKQYMRKKTHEKNEANR